MNRSRLHFIRYAFSGCIQLNLQALYNTQCYNAHPFFMWQNAHVYAVVKEDVNMTKWERQRTEEI